MRICGRSLVATGAIVVLASASIVVAQPVGGQVDGGQDELAGSIAGTVGMEAVGPPCFGDINGDGNVGFSDLLSVLTNWGPYVPCPPIVPEDLNADCDVGFADLLTILQVWGPCGAPFGACCLSDGTCFNASPIECAKNEGEFQGPAPCEPGICGGGDLAACCLADGGCVDGLNQPDCKSMGGLWQGLGTVCSPGLCGVPGACCFPDGSCVDEFDEGRCKKSGGTFGGPGSLCGKIACPPLP